MYERVCLVHKYTGTYEEMWLTHVRTYTGTRVCQIMYVHMYTGMRVCQIMHVHMYTGIV